MTKATCGGRASAIAIIPARGGSKGIPKKNLQRVGGLTLVERAVVSAIESKSFDRVIVSTDDDDIASCARGIGAEVLIRPAELASHEAASEDALLHAVSAYESILVPTTVIGFIQCTSPFIDPADLARMISLVQSEPEVSTFSAIRSHQFSWVADQFGAKPLGHDRWHRPRRQDLPCTWSETGAFYGIATQTLMKTRCRFSSDVRPLEVDPRFALEIDTTDNLDVARELLNLWSREQLRARSLGTDVRVVVTDFDGVLTPDTVYLDERGKETARCSRSDGLGIAMLKRAGIVVAIATSEASPIARHRAAKLGVHHIDGRASKFEAVQNWLEDQGAKWTEVLYVGNDANDVECLRSAAQGVVPSNATAQAIDAATAMLPVAGGGGVIRYLAGAILPKDSSEFRTE